MLILLMRPTLPPPPPPTDEEIIIWRGHVIGGWDELRQYELTYNAWPEHGCNKDTILCLRPSLWGCRACGRTHFCGPAGAPAHLADPCIVAENPLDGSVSCIFSAIGVADRLGYEAAGGFTESVDQAQRMDVDGVSSTGVEAATATMRSARDTARHQSRLSSDSHARQRTRDMANTAARHVQALRSLGHMTAAPPALDVMDEDEPEAPQREVPFLLTHVPSATESSSNSSQTTWPPPLPPRDAEFWDAIYFPSKLGGRARWDDLLRVVPPDLFRIQSGPSMTSKSSWIGCGRGSVPTKPAPATTTTLQYMYRKLSHNTFTLNPPPLMSEWRTHLAYLVSGLLLRVLDPTAVTEEDVAYVMRRVERWCQLLAFTSPRTVLNVPPGHALAAYVLRLARRGYQADDLSVTILPPDLVVTREPEEDRWVGAFFDDPAVWHETRRASTAVQQRRGKRRHSELQVSRSPEPVFSSSSRQEMNERAEQLHREVVLSSAFSVATTGLAGKGTDDVLAARTTRTPTPYDGREFLTRAQITDLATKFDDAYRRCMHSHGWLLAFFTPVA